jgi:ADP-heptose:LPS heptosyltransferase/GT2 family glycosyltransferase
MVDNSISGLVTSGKEGTLVAGDLEFMEKAIRHATVQMAIQSAKIANLRADLALSGAASLSVTDGKDHDGASVGSVRSEAALPAGLANAKAQLVTPPASAPPDALSGTAPKLGVRAEESNASEFMRLELDLPKLKNGRVPETMTMLKMAGWSLADSGIAEISVQIDERPPYSATLGIRRPDVGNAFPHISGSSLAGFGLLLTHRDVGIGEHSVRVVARSRAGKVIERLFQVVLEVPDDSELTLRVTVPPAEQEQRLALLRRAQARPGYAVVINAGNDPDALRQTLASLETQVYEDWRAIVIAPVGQNEGLRLLYGANERALADRVQFIESASYVQEQFLQQLPAAGARVFVVAMAAGTRLAADALLELASAATIDPSVDFFYADERCADPVLGLQPWLKPDWAPDLLLSMNYIGEIWAADVDLIRTAGIALQNIPKQGAYDTVLRLTERARKISRVPKLISESEHLRLSHDERDKIALEAALERRGVRGAVVAGNVMGTWRVQRTVDDKPLISVIIPTCGARGLIKTAIAGIRNNTDYPRIEIVCVDNVPPENPEMKAWLRSNADQVVEVPEKFNWSRFNNLGAKAARGEYLLFLNDDIEIRQRDWLSALLEHAQRPEVGLAGARLLYPNGTVQHAGIFLTPGGGRHAFRFNNPDDPGPFGLAAVQREVTAVTGACQLVRRTVFEALGGYDERHEVVRNDVDFCLRVRNAGMRVIYTPFATLTHHELVSRGNIPDVYDEAAFRATWGTQISGGDPLFNPGLLAEDENYVADPEPVQTLYAGHPLLDKEKLRRILVVKLDHIGDFVLAIPAIRRLRAQFPGAEISVLAAPASCILAQDEPSIDRCIQFSFFDARSELGQREIPEPELLELQGRLEAFKFDLAVDLRMHTDTRPMLQRTGARVLAGFDKSSEFPWLDISLNWEGDTALTRKQVHVADRVLDLIRVIEGACDRGWPTLSAPTSAEALARVRQMPFAQNCPTGFFDRPLVCVHPGVGSTIRRWPAPSYAALVDLMIERTGVSVLLIGAADEAPVVAEVLEKTVNKGSVVAVAGIVPLHELKTLMRACILFIGNNSGPKHIAAALGLPTIGVHSGNVDPLEWGPVGENAVTIHRKMFCGPCYIADPNACSRKLACLTGIRPEHVFRAALPYLRDHMLSGFANPEFQSSSVSLAAND